MMQPCNQCPEWAQWRARKPIRNEKGEIVTLELIAVLCGAHKAEQEKREDNKLVFDFIGAAPCLS